MKFAEPTDDEQTAWREWVASRPDAIRAVAERLNPWTLYRLRTTNQRVFLQSLSEPKGGGPVTCRVAVTGQFNLLSHERSVFGIDPNDLEECDLPDSCDPVGSLDLPVEVLKDLMARYPSGAPDEVMVDLINRYPIRLSTPPRTR